MGFERCRRRVVRLTLTDASPDSCLSFSSFFTNASALASGFVELSEEGGDSKATVELRLCLKRLCNSF